MIPRVSSTIVRPISLDRRRPGSGGPRPPGGPRAGRPGPRSARTARRWSGRSRRASRGSMMKATSPLVHDARLAGDRRQRADHPVVVDQRGDEVAGDLDDAVVALEPVARRPRGRPARPAPARSAGPRRPSPRRAEGRQPPGDVVGDAGPGGHLEPVVAHGSGSSWRRPGAPRFVSSTIIRNSSCAVVRGGQPAGDPEDGVEALGELGLEARGAPAARPGSAPGLGRAIGADDPPEDRAPGRGARSVGRRGGRRRPGRSGRCHPRRRSRAHGPMVARAGPSPEPPSVTGDGG